MNILLVSQCQKRALTETRRILDQFAERRGDRIWQTPITQDGLTTLRKLLRKTARKNTAVACHWIRGKDHSELLWIVGDAKQFNAQGTVPTNTTARNVLRAQDENDWHNAEPMRLLAQLAALMHDLGKASIAFQERLRGLRSEKNLYRHEWVSLRLFLAFVGQDDDQTWLARLADSDTFNEQDWLQAGCYQRDGLDAVEAYPFKKLPNLAAAVAWLIVTHHRMPVAPVSKSTAAALRSNEEQDFLGKYCKSFDFAWLEKPLDWVAHTSNEIRQAHTDQQARPYWTPAAELPVIEPAWRAQAARLAKKFLTLPPTDWLSNPYVMHLARLSLMLADHHYSSLPKGSPESFAVKTQSTVFANTDKDGTLKQTLLEHLLGVAKGAGAIAYALPSFERHLPRLANCKALRKRTSNTKFSWQDKAFDAACALGEGMQKQGGFIVNMASTGCGKTLANSRLLYALSDPELGMRATYALGLRTLTLQTGRSYREDLKLTDDQLAIRVGGAATRELFEYYEQQAEAQGSASIQDLIDEDHSVFYEGNTSHHPLLAKAMADPQIKNLIAAPMLVCTVDHLVPATESLRAGRQIAPMLRLMSSDLILDELDDYDLNDMPALTRLVHWAGLLGTRVVLSSATMPPSLVTGMYQAYYAGRRIYQQNRGESDVYQQAPEIPCLWVDEFSTQSLQLGGSGFMDKHNEFVAKRAEKLRQAPALRKAHILPLALTSRKPEQQYQELAPILCDAALRLHHAHGQTDPLSGKKVSFGLIRFANIGPLFDVARHFAALDAPADTQIHLCVYHARFPLLQRSAIEKLLDESLNRRGRGDEVFQLPYVRSAIDAHTASNHLFVVLASPVCEVGRDWDLDWALAEPSSMRSLIQLAGRIQRHRAQTPTEPNLWVWEYNLKHFKQPNEPAFVRPGFEYASDDELCLNSHSLKALLREEELTVVTALPRIQPLKTWYPTASLVDLEQVRTCQSTLPSQAFREGKKKFEQDYAYFSWLFPSASLNGVLPQQQPFRHQPTPQITLALLPDDDQEKLLLHRVQKNYSKNSEPFTLIEQSLRVHISVNFGQGVSAWRPVDLLTLLHEWAEHSGEGLERSAEKMTLVTVNENTNGWRWHPLLGFDAV